MKHQCINTYTIQIHWIPFAKQEQLLPSVETSSCRFFSSVVPLLASLSDSFKTRSYWHFAARAHSRTHMYTRLRLFCINKFFFYSEVQSDFLHFVSFASPSRLLLLLLPFLLSIRLFLSSSFHIHLLVICTEFINPRIPKGKKSKSQNTKFSCALSEPPR